ncbi:hypothetical protein TKK_0017799 [Trichogramma kaykai]
MAIEPKNNSESVLDVVRENSRGPLTSNTSQRCELLASLNETLPVNNYLVEPENNLNEETLRVMKANLNLGGYGDDSQKSPLILCSIKQFKPEHSVAKKDSKINHMVNDQDEENFSVVKGIRQLQKKSSFVSSSTKQIETVDSVTEKDSKIDHLVNDQEEEEEEEELPVVEGITPTPYFKNENFEESLLDDSDSDEEHVRKDGEANNLLELNELDNYLISEEELASVQLTEEERKPLTDMIKKWDESRRGLAKEFGKIMKANEFYADDENPFESRSKVTWVEEQSLIIGQDFWKKFVPPVGQKSLLDGWTDKFNDIFEQKFTCVLSFCHHNFYHFDKQRNDYYFIAVAKRLHSSCTTFRFIVHEKITKPFRDYCVSVYTSGSIDHSAGESHRRFIKNETREYYKNELLKKAPVKVKLDALNKASDKLLVQGNLNHYPSPEILHKIASKTKSENDLDADYYKFMEKLQENYCEEYVKNYGCNRVKGYIQFNASNPLIILLFSQPQLVLVSKEKDIFLYLDATGTIAKQPKHLKKKETIYYYKLNIAGAKGMSPLEVGESIMSVHDETTVRFFLTQWYNSFRRVSARTIQKIETDFSLVLLKSSCSSFNDIDLYTYMNLIFDHVENSKRLPQSITILHICSSHLIKTIRKKIKKCFSRQERDQIRVATILLCDLIHCRSMEEACPSFAKFIIIYGNKTQDEEHNKMIDEILGRNSSECKDELVDIKKIEEENEENDAQLENNDEKYEENNDEKNDCKTKKSLYYISFKQFKRKILRKSKLTQVRNSYYSEGLVKYVTEYLMIYFSLWSATAISQFGILRDSNASAECGFNILKNFLFRNQRTVEIPRLIQENEKNIRAKLKERQYSLKTTRQKEKNFKMAKVPVEFWLRGKNKKRGPNKHFTQNKFLPPENVENTTEKSKNKNIKAVKRKNEAQIDGTSELAKVVYVTEDTKELELKPQCTRTDKEDHNAPRTKKMRIEKPAIDYKTAELTIETLISSNNSYPPGFPKIKKELNGIQVNDSSFARLMPYRDKRQYLNDATINAFFSLLPETADKYGLSIVIFDTLFFKSIFSDKMDTFIKWGKKEKITNKSIWLIPINDESIRGGHWILLLNRTHTILVLRKEFNPFKIFTERSNE